MQKSSTPTQASQTPCYENLMQATSQGTSYQRSTGNSAIRHAQEAFTCFAKYLHSPIQLPATAPFI